MKSVKPEEVEEDLDWIFSYSDLVSLLLCFFIILYATSKQDEEQKKEVEEALAESFNKDQKEKIEVPDTSHISYMVLSLLGLAPKTEPDSEGGKSRKSGRVMSLEQKIDSKVKETLATDVIKEDLIEKAELVYEFVLPTSIYQGNTAQFSLIGNKEIYDLGVYLEKLKRLRKIQVKTDYLASNEGSHEAEFLLATRRVSSIVRELTKKKGLADKVEASTKLDLTSPAPASLKRQLNGEITVVVRIAR